MEQREEEMAEPLEREIHETHAKGKGKKTAVTESGEGGGEESDDREEDDRDDDEEECHLSGHEERGTGNVGRDTSVQHDMVLEATKKILVQLSEMRERMNAQEETLRTHGEMLNYLYHEARHRQSGGLVNEHGFGSGHDGGSGRGHVVRRGRGSGHGVGGSGGNMRPQRSLKILGRTAKSGNHS